MGEIGVYDYRNRVYHPELGRFLQVDPTGFDAGDMNLFRYCGDDPIDGSDPTGLSAFLPDRIWEMAKYMDTSNTMQGTFQEQMKRMGKDNAGVEATSLSPENEGKKRTPKENLKIATNWLKKHHERLRLPDPSRHKPKLVRLPGPNAGDWNPFRGIRLDPEKNKSVAAFVDSYAEELLHAQAGFIHYLRDLWQGDQGAHHQQIRQRSSEITGDFNIDTNNQFAGDPVTYDH